jgi:heme exporter protein CcmD
MTHLGYLIAAYAAAFGVIAALAVWAIGDLGAQRRRLKRLEEQGLARRPGRAGP